jgi:hypothetical protein
MQLFGHISERTLRKLAPGESTSPESWRLVNQSDSGFMCMLRDPDVRTCVSHNQLVAVRRRASKAFCLGFVRWLRVEETSEVSVGVNLFPGVALAVAMRPTNFNIPLGSGGFERGLLLRGAASSMPTTLILPPGWYQAGRYIEVHGAEKQVAKLMRLFEKGNDFERCAVELI